MLPAVRSDGEFILIRLMLAIVNSSNELVVVSVLPYSVTLYGRCCWWPRLNCCRPEESVDAGAHRTVRGENRPVLCVRASGRYLPAMGNRSSEYQATVYDRRAACVRICS
jgi:hypothetical protein